MKQFLAGLCILCFIPTASAKLEVGKVEPAHGMLGPVRKSLDFYPLDEVFFRYQVSGAAIDADGKTDLEVTLKLLNADGKAAFEQKSFLRRQLALGGNSFPAFVVMTAPEKAEPGEYTLSLQLLDRLSGESSGFERKLTCKSPIYQILALRFWRDPDGRLPASAGGFVGESLHLKLRVVGFDKSKKRVQTVLTIMLLDEAGNPITDRPQVIKAELTSPDEAAKATQVNFNGLLFLNRAGNFTLRLKVDDVEGKQTTTFETPFKVQTP